MREALRYQFPPPEHKHLLGPFTTGQIAITLVALFVAVFGIARHNPTPPRWARWSSSPIRIAAGSWA